MLNANGNIEAVYPKGKYTDLKIGGVYYRSWDAVSVTEGQTVSFQYEEKQNGQYTNRTIKSPITVEGGAPAQPVQQAVPAPKKKAYTPHQSAPSGSLEAALKGKDIKDVEQEILNLPYKESRTLQAASNDETRQNMIVAQSSLASAAQVVAAGLTSGSLKLKPAELGSYTAELAKTFAKEIVAGAYYADPEFKETPNADGIVSEEPSFMQEQPTQQEGEVF